jgi:predicted DCC family thiol-disulfide oxidoreductase YuxK
MTGLTGPAAHGGGRAVPPRDTSSGAAAVASFTVLFDARCPLCRAARRWLAARAQLVPLRFAPAGSAEARALFPGLDHAATLRDLTVIADDGTYYMGDGAWLACLWALADYRAMALRLSTPRMLPAARRFIAAASAVREAVRSPEPTGTDGGAGPGPVGAGGAAGPVGAGGVAGPGTVEGSSESMRGVRPPVPTGAGDDDYGDQCDDRCH